MRFAPYACISIIVILVLLCSFSIACGCVRCDLRASSCSDHRTNYFDGCLLLYSSSKPLELKPLY